MINPIIDKIKTLEALSSAIKDSTGLDLGITAYSQEEIIIMHEELVEELVYEIQELETAVEEANKLSSIRLGKMNEAIEEAVQLLEHNTLLEERLELSRKEVNEAEVEALAYGNECSTHLVRIDELEDETTKLRHQTDSILRAHATIIRGCHP